MQLFPTSASLSFLPGFSPSIDGLLRLLVAFTIAGVGFASVVREGGSRTALLFFALSCSVFLWLAGQAASFAALTPAIAVWWTRKVTLLGVTLLPTLALIFVFDVSGSYRRLRAARWICLGISLLFYLAFSQTSWMIPYARHFWWGWVPQYSPLSITFLVFFAVEMTLCGALIARGYRTASGRSNRSRAVHVVAGLAVASLGVIDYVSTFGVPVYPPGYIAVVGLILVAIRVLKRFRITLIAPNNLGQEIVRTMTDALIVLEIDGKVRVANPPAARIFGLSASEMEGESAFHIPELRVLSERLPGIIERGGETFEVAVKGGDNRTVSFSTSLIYDDDHRPTMVVFVARDLTQHTRDEAALRYERNLLRTLIDHLPVAVYVKDVAGRKIITNPYDVEIMREFRPEGDVIGKTDLEIYPAEVAAPLFADDLSVMRTGEPVIDKMEFYRDREMHGRWLLTSKLPLLDERGRVIGLVGTGRNITDAKLANDKLVASLEEKTVLLQEIHHRVKNNLQVISSLLFLQESRLQDTHFRSIIRDCRNQILSMAQIHEDLYRSGDLRNIHFDQYVRSLTGRLRATFKADTRVELEFALEDVPLTIDKAIPCGLIVNELCLNAFKYAFPKEVMDRAPSIRIELSAVGETIHLAVADNGVGFPKEIDPLRTSSLGMQIVSTLVAQLRGQLRLEGERGTCFTIEFARGEAPDPAHPATRPIADRP